MTPPATWFLADAEALTLGDVLALAPATPDGWGQTAQRVTVLPLSEHDARVIAQTEAHAGELLAAVADPGVASLFSAILGIPVPIGTFPLAGVPATRRVLLGRYCGPELPPGTTTLPAGATLVWGLASF